MAIGLDTASLISLLTEAILFGMLYQELLVSVHILTGIFFRSTHRARGGFGVPPDLEEAHSTSEVSNHHRGHYDADIWSCRKYCHGSHTTRIDKTLPPP